VIFSSNIIKTPKSSRGGAWKKEREKSPRVSSNKRGSQYFGRKNNTSTSKILFDVIPSSPPPLGHFKNPFQNH
jgi:hypothetical protein